ncbi:hypothetical protein HPB50_005434 [Hyalomma asiaticum]|uniref:Uncharacterized protein n=1 Tax=Hyalomma asiaticum TaxID=266040 RepID=A0ACB7TFK6_HYAAI|nr:hypothetical protein HPB50_005434 [Hyalomma asiaticum]
MDNSSDGNGSRPLLPPSKRSKVSDADEDGDSPKSGAVAKVMATPQQVIESCLHQLSAYEQQEIIAYPEIYFFGANATKRQGAVGKPNNCGYDDERGSYLYELHDHIAYRFELLKLIGKGAYGQVMKAYDHKHHRCVALKIVRNGEYFHEQAQEEISILDFLRRRDGDNTFNVIHMLEHFTFRNHTCITFELLYMSLHEMIKENNFKGFPMQVVHELARSLVQCLDALNQSHIIHCDLKPENVLLKQPGRWDIKVIDFGISCFAHRRVRTYIQTRFYRAPEVILDATYGQPIDMWSLGCILAELLTGHPLLTGEDEADQLACIMELLGRPPQELLDQARRANKFFSSEGHPRYCTTTTMPHGTIVQAPGRSWSGKLRDLPGSKCWTTALEGCNDPLFVGFLKRCLEWNPETRMTPAEALQHVWLTQTGV